jgi:hypothetical protein
MRNVEFANAEGGIVMKRFVLVLMLIVAVAAPQWAGAQPKEANPVNAGAGSISLLAHIDFVSRYSKADKDHGWKGYESYNMEAVVLGLAGKIGDNISWIITEELNFSGVDGAYRTSQADYLMPAAKNTNNDDSAHLLDAQVRFHIGPNFMLTVGRFLPPTSMTWTPHMMKSLHAINYPLVNGSGLQNGMGIPGFPAPFLPMPLYQTGVMLTATYEGLKFEIGSFNGTDTIGGFGSLGATGGQVGWAPLGVMNTMDIDKSKGTAMKLSFDTEGFHFGGWYYGEAANVQLYDPAMIKAGTPKVGRITEDGTIAQFGLEADFNSEFLFVQAQYLNTHLDLRDKHVPNVFQWGWYGLVGVHLAKGLDLVGRYDYFMYDGDGKILTGTYNLLTSKFVANEKMNEETQAMVGIHYAVNENVTVGVDYTWKWIENWKPNTNELSAIVEMNLF